MTGIGQLTSTLSPISEQSGNGVSTALAIRMARKASASNKAAQTIAVGEDIALAGTGAAGTIRMALRYR